MGSVSEAGEGVIVAAQQAAIGEAARNILAASRVAGVKDTEPLGVMHAAYAQSITAIEGLIGRLGQKFDAEFRRLFRSELASTRPLVMRDLGWRRAAIFGIALVGAVAIGAAGAYLVGLDAGWYAALSSASDMRASLQDCERTSYRTQGGVACIIWKTRPSPTSQ